MMPFYYQAAGLSASRKILNASPGAAAALGLSHPIQVAGVA
jgi:hypothetical protein